MQDVGGSIPPSTTKTKYVMNTRAKAQKNVKKQWQYAAANYDS